MQSSVRWSGTRRQCLLWVGCSGLLGMGRVGHAATAPDWRAPMVALEGVYVPALFMTGSAGKSAEAARRAQVAVQRLTQAWPALRQTLAALWRSDAAWQRSLTQVQTHIDHGMRHTERAAWAEAHEALEHVRDVLSQARRGKGLDFLPDRYTEFHAEMEALVAASSADGVDRVALRGRLTRALVVWQRITDTAIDPVREGLTPARHAQQAQAVAEESAALSLLSQALDGANDAVVRQRLGAIKPPFIRAYTAFGRELDA